MNAERIDTIKKYAGIALAGAGAVIEVVWPGHAAFAMALAMLGALLTGMGMDNARGKTARQILQDVVKHNSAEPAKRASVAPKATAVGLVAIVLLLGACTAKQAQDVKNVARRVNDIAHELCEATMGADAAKQGISVRELCMLPYIIGPFLQAQDLAAANAKAGAAVSTECAP